MNIFYLSRNPKKCARYQTDAHVVKMPTETCQLLCNVLFIYGLEAPYKPFNPNHPCCLWAAKSKHNWIWLKSLGLELCKEFTHRYGRRHKCHSIIESLECPPEMPDIPFTDPFLAMPDVYKSTNAINSYRRFYYHDKKRMFFLKSGEWRWKNREVPKFILKHYK